MIDAAKAESAQQSAAKQIEAIYPLSPMQEGMLFHTLMNPGTGIYLMQNRYYVEGDVDAELFRRAWEQVIARHSILRTSFVWKSQKRPLQAVQKQVEVPLDVMDWRGTDRAEQISRLDDLLQGELETGFDFAKAPLMRLRLIRLTDHTYQFVHSFHHILLDEWCISPLLMDFLAHYEACAQGRVCRADKPRPYRDYIAWLQKQDVETAQAFWRDYLRDFSTPTPLAYDRLPEGLADQNEDAADHCVHLSADTTETLVALAQRHRLTPNTFVQGAWAILLSYYSGDSDILFGVTVAGRPTGLLGVESVLGLFINTLPLRVSVSPDRHVLPWLKELLAENIRLRQFEYTPLVQIQRCSEVPRGEALFHSLFVFENAPVDPALCEGRIMFRAEEEQYRVHTNYPMTVMGWPGKELGLKLSYDRRLFDSETVERMIGHLKRLLEAMVQRPDARIGELPLLGQDERTQLLSTWTDRAAQEPDARSFAVRFEEQVQLTPQSPAVSYQDQVLSYRELNRQANRLAHALVSAGVGPESVVALLDERGPDLLTMIVGCFKAGGAYLPLDPHHPTSRLVRVLELSQASVVVTSAGWFDRMAQALAALPSAVRPSLLSLDVVLAEPGSEDDLPARGRPEHLAYVIYTSGSTGVPKGAMVTQCGMLNNMSSKLSSLRIEATDVIAQTASQCFDISVWQFLTALLCGARTHIVPDETVRDPSRLLPHLEEAGITLFETVPALLQALLETARAAASPPALSRLRWVLPTGEALPSTVCRQWFVQYPQIPLMNAYGPAECADDVAVHPIMAAPSEDLLHIPIGRAIQNIRLYIVNSFLSPVPSGVPGELCIGGIGVGRGYVQDPARTAESFLPDPFGTEQGARLYRTGDLARYRRDGTIEYLGRLDHQVKIRGFRIELGEIETHLSRHPSVREAVVVVREDRPGDRRLVAYVVHREAEQADAAALRQFLEAQLPDYMVPAAFLSLDMLPRTINGKVDRRVLPPPDADDQLAQRYVAPRTTTEELLAGMWVDILAVDRVGVHDHFFELGGHSLLATQIVSRIRSAFHIELPLRTVFESPTVSELAAAVDEMRLKEAGPQAPPIVPVPKEGPLPLSFAQQRLWFLAQLEPDSWFYNLSFGIRLAGPLDATALQASFETVARRHDMLRTTFVTIDGRPAQVIDESLPMPFACVTVTPSAGDDVEQEVQRLAAEEARYAFDIEDGLLWRARLFQLSEQDHVLMVTLHHVIADGWSLNLLLADMVSSYAALRAGRPSPLQAPRLQYVDYAQWQRGWLVGEVLERQLDYWKRTLAGAPAVLPLHTDHPRPAVQTFRGARHVITISSALTAALHSIGRRQGATLFMTLLAAFQVLLHRYSGETDLSIGTPIANRTTLEVEELIGFFVNTLVLRTDLSGNPRFIDLLDRVREIVLGAQSHQDLPFEHVVDALRPARDLSHAPLFQVMFALQTLGAQTVEIPDLKIDMLEIDPGSAKFDLSLEMTLEPDGLTGFFEYNLDLFDPSTIERMAGHFQSLLEALVAQPEQRLAALPLMGAAERATVVEEWNATERTYPTERTVSELIAAQAEATPAAIAVRDAVGTLTYRELLARANQVAQALRVQGVGPGSLVGIAMERSLDLVIGLLGILQAGAAYVPLDPSYPADRLAFMLADSQVAVLLTHEHLVAPLGFAGFTLCLDRDASSLAQQPTTAPSGRITAQHLAYVIYTSGSTGRPKGVMVRHGSVVNFLLSMQETLRLTADEVIAATTSVSFDIAVLELFLPLLLGAKTVVISREVVRDGQRLASELARVGATLMQATPSGWRMLLSAAPIPRLRVLCGGEAFPRKLAQEFLANDLEPWNLYGPTETTVWSMMTRVTGADEAVPLGRPVANTQIYLLDSDVNLVPIGVPGEVYIGGDGLARGYWRRPELTAERFIPNPFSKEPGDRLYRTGDLARYRADGRLEFLGRADHQVKLRGHRIELGEIESCLNRHPQIAQSIVLARRDGEDTRLVAYMQQALGSSVAEQELKRFLQAQLPEYMVPSTFVFLDVFPLTPNGKVDRKALPIPGVDRIIDQGVAPPRAVEEILIGIWTEALEVTPIGLHDNFFELGGHSLLATQVMSRVRAAFQIELPLRSLFDAPTIEGVAAAIDRAVAQDAGAPAPPIVPVARTERLPLSFAQQRLWFLAQMDPESGAYNLPFALRLEGSLNRAALEGSFTELIRRHETLRTTFPSLDGEARQVIVPSERFALETEDLTGCSEEERAASILRHAEAEAQRPFALERDVPIRARLLQVRPDEHILLVTVHHIAADAWSLALVTNEVAAVYRALVEASVQSGEGSTLSLDGILPDLPVQYMDFSSWQRRWLQGEVLEREVGYWKQRLGSNPPPLALRTDHPRPEVQTYHGGRVTFLVPKEVAEPLRALSRRHGATVFMTLLAAFKVFLSRYTGQTDILVGTDVANRNRHETEHLIGFFVNLLPLRTDVSGNPSFIDLLGRVRETALGAYAHQDLPFEKIVDALKLSRDLSRNPLVQVLFVLQNVPPPSLQLPGLNVEALEFEHEVSRFDLGLFMEESDDGLEGLWKFSRDLFEPESIASMTQRFLTLLRQIVASPERGIDQLDMLSDEEKEARTMEAKQREDGKLQRFKNIKPKAVKLSQRTLVTSRPLSSDRSLPLMFTPAVEDVDLIGWAKSNQAILQRDLLKHGALLFRGFSARTVEDFEAVAQAVCPELFGEYGDLPREKSGRHVYGSTPYPPDRAILFHNESSHMHRWPQKQFFFCVQVAPEGGETPIVDCRTMYQGLRPELREQLQSKQLMYVRNFTPGVDVSWQDFFRSTDKATVEAMCAQNGMECMWMEKDSLRTRQICPAVIEHPKTGDWVFFNQIQLHHVSCLEPAVRESLLSMLGMESIPRNVYYGDGSPIDDAVVAEIGELYERTAVRFRWQEGDLLMLDNMLVAHARDPFTGPRKIVVAMGDMISQTAIQSVTA